MLHQNLLTKEQAYQKLKYYCTYQDRCHSEVKDKAYSYGMSKTEVEELISRLIEENYLNEERFAVQFAGGKFRMKKWGRNKIKNELKQKQVSEYCIRKAIGEIDELEYTETLGSLAAKKWASIRGTGINQFVKMTKTRNFLLQKGYESEIIMKVLTEFIKK